MCKPQTWKTDMDDTITRYDNPQDQAARYTSSGARILPAATAAPSAGWDMTPVPPAAAAFAASSSSASSSASPSMSTSPLPPAPPAAAVAFDGGSLPAAAAPPAGDAEAAAAAAAAAGPAAPPPPPPPRNDMAARPPATPSASWKRAQESQRWHKLRLTYRMRVCLRYRAANWQKIT